MSRHPTPAELEVERLEHVLLDSGAQAPAAADEDRCADCGRTPLVGEHVHLHAHIRGIVCELCALLRRDRPVATERVRHAGYGHTARLTRLV